VEKGFVVAGFLGRLTLDCEKETQQNSKGKNTFSKILIKCQIFSRKAY
jgi:hypothetical protein